MTPFEVLGVPPTASPEEITAAYRTAAQIFHPDRFVDCPEAVRREAERRMRELNEAYAALRRAGATRRSRRARPDTSSWVRGDVVQRVTVGVPFDLSAQARAAQAIRAEQDRLARERAAPNGQARPRQKQSRARDAALAGLGEALYTNNITCRTCGSVQWLPPGWTQTLIDTNYHCSICDRLLLAR